MDVRSGTVTSSGLQDWFTDLDRWVCRFDAQIKVSRLHKRDENAVFEHKCQFPALETKSAQKLTQPSFESPVALQEIFVNGLLIAHKKNLFRNKDDFLNILNMYKGNEDCTNFDYVLFTQVIENGRRHFYKCIRSKI